MVDDDYFNLVYMRAHHIPVEIARTSRTIIREMTEKDLPDMYELYADPAVARWTEPLYAYEEELRQGFFTIQGGHRIGVAGKVVLEHGAVKTMKYLSFLNVRIAHEIRGCADGILPYIYCLLYTSDAADD